MSAPMLTLPAARALPKVHLSGFGKGQLLRSFLAGSGRALRPSRGVLCPASGSPSSNPALPRGSAASQSSPTRTLTCPAHSLPSSQSVSRRRKGSLGPPHSVRDTWPVLARRGMGFLAEMETLKEQAREEKDGGASSALDFRAPLQVVLYPDPRLRAANKLITNFNDPRLGPLVEAMLDAMYRFDGVGLSAPQVGVNVRLMVYNPAGERGEGKEYVLFNPRIVKATKTQDVENEGCLSFLDIRGNVQRPEGVKVEAQDLRGRRFSLSLKGWQSRIFQHEFDHLQGKLFFERMTPEVLASIRPQLLDLESKYEEETQQPRPESVGQGPTV